MDGWPRSYEERIVLGVPVSSSDYDKVRSNFAFWHTRCPKFILQNRRALSHVGRNSAVRVPKAGHACQTQGLVQEATETT